MNKNPQKKYLDETPLDDYEKELKEFLDKGEFVSASNIEETKHMLEDAARRHVALQGSQRISLRVNKKNLIQVKARAKRKHIPYQTLINLLINRYAEGNSRLAI